MSIRTTKKAIMETYNNIICVSYCGMQNLLHYVSPTYHTTGIYGWNCDVYHTDYWNGLHGPVIVSTGYRPFGNIRPDYDLLKEYENKAEKIIYDHSIPYEEKKKAVDKLLYQFIKQVLSK